MENHSFTHTSRSLCVYWLCVFSGLQQLPALMFYLCSRCPKLMLLRHTINSCLKVHYPKLPILDGKKFQCYCKVI